jgi:alkylhydroperoxidase family enzyme
MAKLLHEIEWESPLLGSQDINRLSPWLREAIESFTKPQHVAYAPLRLMDVTYLVASQENACRYCYGTARAMMKISGYSERQIQDLEHEASLADGTTRQAVEFARKLARSNPSPAKKDRDALLQAGLSKEAVAEIAANVVKACFANRMATFLALAPDASLERLPESWYGRLFGFVIRMRLGPRRAPPPAGFRNEGPCAKIIAEAGNTPIAMWLRALTDGWLASELIPRRTKLLILAVVARQLGSQLCEQEVKESLAEEGLSARETEMLLATLNLATMTQLESTLLRWTRETVWYEPRTIQDSTRRLLGELGEKRTLDAVGSAALGNALARLSLVRQ